VRQAPGPAWGLQAEGELAVWLELDAEEHGRVWAARVGGEPRRSSPEGGHARVPATDGHRVGWWVDHVPTVLDPGADGELGTPDDVSLLEPIDGLSTPGPDSTQTVLDRPRLRWLEGDLLLLGPRLYDLGVLAADAWDSGPLDLEVPDGGAAMPSLELDAPAWQRVHDLRVSVAVEHPGPSQVRVFLVSPSDDEALLWDGQAAGGVALDDELSIHTSPRLLDHWYEPLAGSWTLRVEARAGGGAGVLRGWTLTHRP